MRAHTWIRCLLPWAVLGGAARSAFADGVFPNTREVDSFFLQLVLLVVVGMVMIIAPIVLVRLVIRRRRKAAAVAAAAQAVPTARVVVPRKPR